MLINSRSSIRINKKLSQIENDKCFSTRAAWLSSEINVHTLTFIFILASKGNSLAYTLNIHLFSSQPAKSTFRTTRSLSGSLSSITNFSFSQFISKIASVSIKNQIKSIEHFNNTDYSIKFPTHHKNRRDESNSSTNIQNVSTVTIQDIEQIITKAYNKAELLMNSLQVTKILKEFNINDMNKLSSFVFQELDKKSTVNYSVISSTSSSHDDYDSLDDDENDNSVDESDDIDLVECMEDLGSEHEKHNMVTSKQTFHEMRIYEKINAAKINHYFKIYITNQHYYMQKQTAPRLLACNKNHLSSDRCFRVKQTNKQH